MSDIKQQQDDVEITLDSSNDEDSLFFKTEMKSSPNGSPISKENESYDSSDEFMNSPLKKAKPQKSIETVLNSRIAQMRSLTSPSDIEQVQFLDSISKVSSENISTKLSSFLDFIISRLSNATLDMTVMKNDLMHAKEDLRISENRSSRLLMHLQQNVKLITKLATNENETTLVQEACANLKSLQSVESDVIPRFRAYSKALREVFTQRKDSKLVIEALELLKQEIGINSLMRKQTESLTQQSLNIQKSISVMKKEMMQNDEMSRAEVKKLVEKLKKENASLKNSSEKKNELIDQISEILGVNEDEEIVMEIPKIMQSNNQLLNENQQLRVKLNETVEKYHTLEKKAQKVFEENRQMKEDMSKREINIEKARKRLFEALCENENKAQHKEIDLLVYGANASIRIINEHKKCKTLLKAQNGELPKKILDLLQENQQLNQLEERNQNLLAKQTSTLHELQQQLSKQKEQELYDEASRISSHASIISQQSSIVANQSQEEEDVLSINDIDNDEDLEMSLESINHMNELDSLKAEFSTIGRELEELQNQMKFKMDNA